MGKFVSTMRKGFQITFENGLTASVQWGAENYCDSYFPDDYDFSCSKDAMSTTAEVAVSRGENFWMLVISFPKIVQVMELSQDG